MNKKDAAYEKAAERYFAFNGGAESVKITHDTANAVTGSAFNANGPRVKTRPGNIPVKRGRPAKKR